MRLWYGEVVRASERNPTGELTAAANPLCSGGAVAPAHALRRWVLHQYLGCDLLCRADREAARVHDGTGAVARWRRTGGAAPRDGDRAGARAAGRRLLADPIAGDRRVTGGGVSAAGVCADAAGGAARTGACAAAHVVHAVRLARAARGAAVAVHGVSDAAATAAVTGGGARCERAGRAGGAARGGRK